MINLLPLDAKKQTRAARANVILLRYNVLAVVAFIFLSIVLGIAYFYLANTKKQAEDSIAINASKESSYAKTKADAQVFRTELADAKSILSEEITYAKAALNIARMLPEGTSLDKVSINKESFTKPLDLTVNIKGEDQAVKLINNFERSPLFSQVKKGKISIGSSKYPYVMNLTVMMSKEAAK